MELYYHRPDKMRASEKKKKKLLYMTIQNEFVQSTRNLE